MAKNQAAVKKLKQDLAEIRGALEGAVANHVMTAGTDMEDGSVFVGFTSDGKKKIFAMPMDLGFTATFNDAAKAVESLNKKKSLGHDDWQIADFDTMRVVFKSQEEGSLKGTFIKNDSGDQGHFPARYWTSSQYPSDPSIKFNVCFWDGGQSWAYEDDDRLSCRPVRIVPAAP